MLYPPNPNTLDDRRSFTGTVAHFSILDRRNQGYSGLDRWYPLIWIQNLTDHYGSLTDYPGSRNSPFISVPYSKTFQRLGQLQPGDQVQFIARLVSHWLPDNYDTYRRRALYHHYRLLRLTQVQFVTVPAPPRAELPHDRQQFLKWVRAQIRR